MKNKPQSTELAEILRSYVENRDIESDFSQSQHKAFTDIMNCRTSKMGGHIEQCDTCGHVQQSYNSCRNRHCPKCQYMKIVQWVDNIASVLPPVRHYHIVFTIPHTLCKLFLLNQEKAYSLLLQAAGKTLMHCAAKPDVLGAQAGAVAILHTWGQTLTYHPHIHMIVPAGGVSDDGMEWIHGGSKFFISVKLLSKVFRGILYRLLEERIENGKIRLSDDIANVKQLKKLCYAKEWNVNCQKSLHSKTALIKYLGNYTHRVAISNHRLVALKNGNVTFSYKDYKCGGLQKLMTLSQDEFVRRFMMHILKSGFYKIRYFGFLSICHRNEKLEHIYSLIDKTPVASDFQGLTSLEVWRVLSGRDPIVCAACNKGKMRAMPLPKPTNIQSG